MRISPKRIWRAICGRYGRWRDNVVSIGNRQELLVTRITSAALCFFLFVCCNASVAAPATGEAAPDVPLGTTASGASVKVADYLGKVAVVSFWASWCAPCRKELPILEGLQREGKGNIQVIAVNIEDHSVFEKAAKVLGELRLLLVNDHGNRS